MTYQNMPEEQRRQKGLEEQQQPRAQGWAISGDPLREALPAAPYKATVSREEQEAASLSQRLEYQTAETRQTPVAGPAPMFGYIGVGIVIAAMLVGLAGMVIAIVWFIGWMNG